MRLEEILKTGIEMTHSKKAVLSTIVTAQHISDEIAEILKPFDISSPQFNVLRILRGQKGVPANLNTIQDRMISKMSNTTRLVDKLVAKKLVKRVTCEKNRRKVEITITKEGLQLLDDIDPIVEKAEQRFVENLNEQEKNSLIDLLEKIRN